MRARLDPMSARFRIGGLMPLTPFCLCFLLCPTAGDSATERPNILFAFADDWGRYASAYAALEESPTANSLVETPNFDRVARAGVLFTNAYVTAPSCTPCRSSVLSGQYFFRTGLGTILQGAEWDSSIPSYPLLLNKAGYHIGQTYKVWTPGIPSDAPYGEREFEYESAGQKFNQFSQNVTKMVAEGKSIEAAKEVLFEETKGNFESFLADRKKGQPFCYWFGPTNMHRKWTKGSGKVLWGLDSDELKGILPEFLPDVHDVREDLADYLGEVMAFDAALGLMLDKLEAMGELENTLVVVSGDHGIPGFTHGKTNLYDYGTNVCLAASWPAAVKGGRVVEDFVNLMDLAPTFLEAGGVEAPAVMTGKSIVNVLKSSEQGWVDGSRTHVVTGRERHVGGARDGFLPYPQRSLRNKDFLYIRNFKPDRWPEGNPRNITASEAPTAEALTENTMITFSDMDSGPTKAWLVLNRENAEVNGAYYYDMAFGKRPGEELYDLAKDPDQVRNVANDPAYAGTLKVMGEQLIDVLEEAKDPRVMGDGSTFDNLPYTKEYKRSPRKTSNKAKAK